MYSWPKVPIYNWHIKIPKIMFNMIKKTSMFNTYMPCHISSDAN